MIRSVNHPFGATVEHWIKIVQASFFNRDGLPIWIVSVTVGKGQGEVDGWVFVEPQYMELRFESHPSMAPPGFLSGEYLSQGVEESSLALLFDNPRQVDVADIEKDIRTFIGKCKFCVRRLTDIATATYRQEATSYRYGCATIPIKRTRRCNVVSR